MIATTALPLSRGCLTLEFARQVALVSSAEKTSLKINNFLSKNTGIPLYKSSVIFDSFK